MGEEPNPNVLVYFNTVIVGFVCGDIDALLEWSKTNHKGHICGPLLACTFKGIDTLGGMMCGFKTPSGCRSEKFMQERMRLSEDESETLYRRARCGLLHEGAPQKGVGICIDHRYPTLLFHRRRSDTGKCVHVNVVALAQRFRAAVEAIREDPSGLKHVPKDTGELTDAHYASVPFHPSDEPQSSSSPSTTRGD